MKRSIKLKDTYASNRLVAPIPSPVAPSRPDGYKASFKSTFILMSLWSLSPFLAAVPLLFGWHHIAELSRTLLAVTVMNLWGVAVFVNSFPVSIDETGVRGFDSWGRDHCVAWSAITSVKPANLLGFKYLRVACGGTGVELWLPLFLSDLAGFQAAILHHAPPQCVLWQFASGATTPLLASPVEAYGDFNANAPTSSEAILPITAGRVACLKSDIEDLSHNRKANCSRQPLLTQSLTSLTQMLMQIWTGK